MSKKSLDAEPRFMRAAREARDQAFLEKILKEQHNMVLTPAQWKRVHKRAAAEIAARKAAEARDRGESD